MPLCVIVLPVYVTKTGVDVLIGVTLMVNTNDAHITYEKVNMSVKL